MSVSAADKIKIWLFPTVMSLLAALIWHDVNEIRTDVKALMAQSSIDKTRIDNLERIVYNNKSTGFLETKMPPSKEKPFKDMCFEFILIRPEDLNKVKKIKTNLV
jgi:hypothetical protein